MTIYPVPGSAAAVEEGSDEPAVSCVLSGSLCFACRNEVLGDERKAHHSKISKENVWTIIIPSIECWNRNQLSPLKD